ncbi:MAG: vWA domain-containing protein [Bacteroidota bacterium]
MFKFAHPYLLYALGLVPLVIILYLLARRRRKKYLETFGQWEVIRTLMPEVSKSKARWKFVLLTLGLFFLILGAAGPQFGSKLEEVKREGIEIIIALDVSNSMLAEDIKPNRLERAKQAISQLVDQLDDDRIGLIVFAGDAYTQIPITSDYVSAKMFLSTISTDIVPKQGTAIGSAIGLGMKSFSPDTEASKVMIVITDGENHEDDPVKFAEQAAEEGILIYTIGMGSPKGVPIPASPGSTQAFRKDREGNVIMTKLDEQTLSRIAAVTDGKYIPASNTSVGLNRLFRDIKNMESAEIETKIYTEYNERYQYLIALAVLFLLIEVIMVERKSRWLSKMNLFGPESSEKNK